MLLKVGAAMMVLAVALAAVVAAVVGLSGPEEEAISQTASVEPVSSPAQEQEKRKFDPSEKLVIDDEPKEEPAQEEPAREKPTKEKPVREKPTREEPPAKKSEAPPQPTQVPAPAETSWPAPSEDEVAATQAPRYYPQREDGVMTLTVEGIGLYDVPVINENSQQALDNGVIHFPETPMPWDERDQKNVYLAGHRLGWEGTGSRLVFYNLDKLKSGDAIVLRDSLGEPYEYRVSEVFVVEPDADWVVDPVRGRDMVTLQTCILPDLLNRLIVRADRV